MKNFAFNKSNVALCLLHYLEHANGEREREKERYRDDRQKYFTTFLHQFRGMHQSMTMHMGHAVTLSPLILRFA